ncbi:MAG: hypothetical protein HXY46_05385 [Syntrophaceae bacterium]|nr:hypothetical protein [Syntrophaceae bacterium]
MFETMQIAIKNNEEDARVLAEKLKLKGYSTTINKAQQAVLDGTDLGGHYDYLRDVDGELFVIVATK